MIKKRSSVLFMTIGMLGMILFSGCGAGTSGDVPAPEPGQTVAASIDLLVSNPQLDSQQPTQTVPAPTASWRMRWRRKRSAWSKWTLAGGAAWRSCAA